MEEGRDRPSEGLFAAWSGHGAGRAAMEEGRDRPSEAEAIRSLRGPHLGRNGGGPRSALGGTGQVEIYNLAPEAAMEEGRDRPSEES